MKVSNWNKPKGEFWRLEDKKTRKEAGKKNGIENILKDPTRDSMGQEESEK